MKTLLTLLTVILMSTALHAQQDETISVTYGGSLRTVLVHWPVLPTPANLPVVFCFHGSGQTAEQIRTISGLNALADQYNFIVVYPQALNIGGEVQWNVYVDDQPGHGGLEPPVTDAPDDIGLVRALIDNLVTRAGIDRKRVFATGLSNGGFMSYALSILASDAIAAIAPVAGSLWSTSDGVFLNGLIQSGSVKTMPVMHVHGTADNVVDYPDPDNKPVAYGEWPLFVGSRACGATTYSEVVPIMAGVDKLVFCPPPVEVSLIRIQGMGHAWTNGTYPTSQEIVKFFGLAGTSSVAQPIQEREYRVMMNRAETMVHVELPTEATVQMVSASGETLYSAGNSTGALDIPCDNLPAGLYLVRVLPKAGGMALTRPVIVVR
jgi:poly(3-hydroxybutyrate) depolymerase